jgi:aspartate aminotransferase-like enzyme
MINHRGPEFAALLARIDRRMRVFFGTQQEVLLITAAGTGGLEAAIVNALSPADRVLAVPNGAFGDRFAKIASVYGADVTRLETEWGRAADPAALRAHLAADADYRAVLLTHNETSTGVTNPIAALAAVVRELAPEALILVDGVSALGAVPFEMDAWGLDVVVTGSQKAWMAAPGMSMIALSDRAWVAADGARMPRFYFDLRDARKSAATGQTPWTPAVAVMYQVDAGLALMEAETPAGVFARHATCAAATRAGLEALGFRLLADPAFASNTVTAAWIPEDLDWKAFNGEVKARQVVLAGGQGTLKGKIFRVGHLGAVNVDDILGAIGVLEEVARAFGRPVEPGAAVAAAQRAVLATVEARLTVAEGVPA